MTAPVLIEGRAAALRIENLDTDQIMPKQFLRGIDKSGLKEGLLYDLRFDASGQPRPDFVLNREAYAGASILIGGSNFGCGSSREHAVWGLQQFGIRAIVASSYAEIFHSNAMNNRLLLVTLSPEEIARLMDDADDPAANSVTIDIGTQTLRSRSVQASFELLPRHRRMFLEGLDSIGLSLTYQDQIAAFEDVLAAIHGERRRPVDRGPAGGADVDQRAVRRVLGDEDVRKPLRRVGGASEDGAAAELARDVDVAALVGDGREGRVVQRSAARRRPQREGRREGRGQHDPQKESERAFRSSDDHGSSLQVLLLPDDIDGTTRFPFTHSAPARPKCARA